MAGPSLGWFYLPNDIQYLIFKEISYLDWLKSRDGWKDIVNSLLVCKTWNFALKHHLTRSGPVDTLLEWGSEPIALAALTRALAAREAKPRVNKAVDGHGEVRGDKKENNHRGEDGNDASEDEVGLYENLDSDADESDITTSSLDEPSLYDDLESDADESDIATSSRGPPIPGTVESWLFLATSRSFVCCMRLLLESNTSPNMVGWGIGLVPMAVLSGNTASLQVLLKHGVLELETYDMEATPLSLALQCKQLSMVKLLLERDVETGILVPTDKLVELPPISFAVEADDIPLARLLLDYISPSDDEYRDFGNPIARAIRRNNPLMVSYLLAKGTIDMNLPRRVQSLLGEAAALGRMDCIHALIENGEHINNVDRNGRTALARALKSASDSFIIDFMKYRPTIDELCFKLAVRRSTTVAAKLLLQVSAPCQARYALHEAARIGSVRLVKLFLRAGISPNAYGYSTGEQAIHAAASKGKTGVVARLLYDGADANSQCYRRGETALYRAAARGFVDVVRLLLKHGAGPNVRTHVGDYALQAAVSGKHEEVVRILLEHGANVNYEGGPCGSVLNAARSVGSECLTDLLLKHGAKEAVPKEEPKDVLGLKNQEAGF